MKQAALTAQEWGLILLGLGLFFAVGAALLPSSAWGSDGVSGVTLVVRPDHMLLGKVIAHSISLFLLLAGFLAVRGNQRKRVLFDWHLLGLGSVITALALTHWYFDVVGILERLTPEDAGRVPGGVYPYLLIVFWSSPAIALVLDALTSIVLRRKTGAGWSLYWSAGSLAMVCVTGVVALLGRT